MEIERGDVIRTVDPFKLGTVRQRPWLVCRTDAHPFAAEQCIAIALSTRSYPDSIPLDPEVWAAGGIPERSFASP